MKQGLLALLREKTEILLAKMDVELVDLSVERQGSKKELVFYIYRKEGTGIELCEEVSRRIEEMIDLDIPLDEPYHLVVSSPDLSRPLKTDADLRRNIGETLELKLRNPIDKQYHFVGKLISYNDEEIIFETPVSNSYPIRRSDIKQISIYIDF